MELLYYVFKNFQMVLFVIVKLLEVELALVNRVKALRVGVHQNSHHHAVELVRFTMFNLIHTLIKEVEPILNYFNYQTRIIIIMLAKADLGCVEAHINLRGPSY